MNKRTQQGTGEREAFESHMERLIPGSDLRRHEDGEYLFAPVQCHWQGWQARSQVLEGVKLVPVEPTLFQLRAAAECSARLGGMATGLDYYRAMVAARPLADPMQEESEDYYRGLRAGMASNVAIANPSDEGSV